MDDDYDDEDYDFAIKATSPNNGYENEGPSQPINTEGQDIKEEDVNDEENIDIFVKEEDFEKDDQLLTIENEPFIEHKLEAVNNEDAKIDVRLTSIPIVYTTRIDDMEILKLKNDFSTKNYILNEILKESIPNYDNQKSVKKLHSPRSFIALKQKLNKLDEQVERGFGIRKSNTVNKSENVLLETKESIKSHLRNENLMSMCKPCSIVLKKIDENDKIKLKKRDKIPIKITFTNYEHKKCCLIFHDTSNRQVDVYCIINGSIKENFTLKNIDNVDKLPRISEYKQYGIFPKVVDCCCWQQRELFINSLDFKAFKQNIKEFMRKPHYCKFDQCTCCCKPGNEKEFVDNTSSNVSLEETEIKALDEEISETLRYWIIQRPVEYGYESDWLENLLKGTKGVETFVNRALNYTRPSPMLKSKNKNISKNFKPKSAMQIDGRDEVELIELQEEGDIVAYKKVNSGKTHFKFKYNMKNPKNEFKSCCWFKRDQIISDLRAKTPPSLQKFLKLPHNCLPKECTCCCKPQETSLPLISIALPEQGTLYTAITTKQPSSFKYSPCPQEIVKPVSELPTLSNNTLPKVVTPVLPKLATAPKNMSNTTREKVNKQSEQNKKIQYVTVPPVDNNAQELAVDSLITSILDRFKDVRLTINEEGKVAAALNAPVNTLTTSELKVLANILAHAQAQVKALGLRPGSLLNAVDIHGSHIQSQGNSLKPVKNTDQPADIHTVNSSAKTTSQNSHVHSSSNKTPKIPVPNLLKSFSNISQNNSSSLMKSYTSFMRAQNKANPISDDQNNSEKDEKKDSDEGFVPIIASVFSLKGWENVISQSESSESTALNAWSETEPSESAAKRKTDHFEPQPPSKIRVVDPAKLGITQHTSTNLNFMGTQLQSYSTQHNFLTPPPGVTLLPTQSVMGSGTIQSFPELNKALVGTTSTVTSNLNNIFVVNSLGSVGSENGNNALISPTNSNISNNFQRVTPLNINTIAQNFPKDHDNMKSSTVFTISNLDRTTVAEPRLLNADPVIEPKKNPSSATLYNSKNKVMTVGKNKFIILNNHK